MKCVIMGAGKIARGFIGHLLYLSGIPFTFMEKADGLVELINERRQYTVNILGHSEKNCVVRGQKPSVFRTGNGRRRRSRRRMPCLLRSGERIWEPWLRTLPGELR